MNKGTVSSAFIECLLYARLSSSAVKQVPIVSVQFSSVAVVCMPGI